MTKTMGQVAFEAYNAARGGVTHDGKRTPPWEELGDGVRAGWQAAADAVRAGAVEAHGRERIEDPAPASSALREWALLELMGHRRFAGLVQDVELFGGRMCRIDIPSEPPATQFYGGSAIYCLTPVDEATARAFARNASRPQPIHRYELAADVPARAVDREDDEFEDGGGDEF